MDNYDQKEKFCMVLDQILLGLRDENDKSVHRDMFKNTQLLYSIIYQLSTASNGASDQVWIINIYEKYMNELPVLRSVQSIQKELRILKNIFAYSERQLIIVPNDIKILAKRNFWIEVYNKYSSFYMIFESDPLICRDIIIYVGKLLIDTLKPNQLQMSFSSSQNHISFNNSTDSKFTVTYRHQKIIKK